VPDFQTCLKVDVEAALTAAATHRDRTQFDLAWAKISIAAGKIQNGYAAWNKWQQAREVGADKTIVTIKVSQAVATRVVTARGTSLPALIRMGFSSEPEAIGISMQNARPNRTNRAASTKPPQFGGHH